MERSYSLRPYQREIVEELWRRRQNSIVVLPTGTGKTFIEMELAAREVERGGRAIVFAPTRALVRQHAQTFARFLNTEVGEITGLIKGERRKNALQRPIVIATPHSLVRDELPFTMAIFDECHHTVGNHAYAVVAKRLSGWKLGFTASPGFGDKLEEIKQNLGIEHAVIKTEEDLKDYRPMIQTKWIKVDLPPSYREILEKINEIKRRRYELLAKLKLPLPRKKSELLKLPEAIKLLPEHLRPRAFMAYIQLIHLSQIQEYIEIEDPSLAFSYWLRTIMQSKRAVEELRKELDPLMSKVKNLPRHPKLTALKRIITKEEPPGIVFVQYREMVDRIKETVPSAIPFLGRSGKKGLEALRRFREEGGVLVATSVAEEGIDVPSVNYVVFYEAVPSEIRAIQRRGRAGRVRSGRIYFLIARRTRDEAYYFAAKRKEKKMRAEVKSISKPAGLLSFLDDQ